jgi:hypothetical protein
MSGQASAAALIGPRSGPPDRRICEHHDLHDPYNHRRPDAAG